MGKKLTLDDYNAVAKSHNGEFIGTLPKNGKTVTSWKCNIGHVFSTTYRIVTKHWCRKCAMLKRANTLEDYKCIAQKRNGVFLDELPRYAQTKARWMCSKGHCFSMNYNMVKKGEWCGKCSKNRRLVLDDYYNVCKNRGGEFIGKILPKNNNTKTQWKCDKNHIFEMTYANILREWCPICSGHIIVTKEFLNNMCNGKGEFIGETIPKNNHTKTLWLCYRCKLEFKACYININAGTWCPNCASFRTERLCRKLIYEVMVEKLNVDAEFIKQRPKFLNGLELDGYNESLNVAFEYNGLQHYKFVKHFHRTQERFIKQKERDERKRRICSKMKVLLLDIPYKYSFMKEKELKIFIEDYINDNFMELTKRIYAL